MTKPKLEDADKPAFAGLSRPAVEITMAGLKPFLRRSTWVGRTNRYAINTIKHITNDYRYNTVRQRNLAQYIAASSVLHVNDAWSYLGRAVASMLVGDAHRALHLAYYAELRATIALLASSGLGVFNRRHVAIDAVNSTAKLATRHGTHQMAWLALAHWSRLPASGDLFARLVSVSGISLEQWFAPVGGASRIAPQAHDWFMQWGMDLRFAAKDRDSRNESSYQPDGIPTTARSSSAEVLEFVRELWLVLEPAGSSTFDQLDRHVLRLALEQHYRGISDKEPTQADPAYLRLVRSCVLAQGLPASASGLMERFLLREVMPEEPAVFSHSRLSPSVGGPFAVASRAAFLLRMATGSTRDLLTKSGLDRELLAFWWRDVGGRGLWADAEPGELTDLWADIRDLLADTENLQELDPSAVESFGALRQSLRDAFSVASSYERVGLWALLPL
jgi:hypothetical protein